MATFTCVCVITAFVGGNFAVDHVRSFTWCVPTTNETAGDIGGYKYNPWDSPWAGASINLIGVLDSILCSGGQQNCLLLNTAPWHWVLECMVILLVLHNIGVPPQPPPQPQPQPPPQPIPARDNDVLRNLFVGVNGNFVANLHNVPRFGLNRGRIQPED